MVVRLLFQRIEYNIIMKLDNFQIFRDHLTFETPQDRYIVNILRRPKDVKHLNQLGSNECQRLLRTYYIDSLEYFDKKIPAIKELCDRNCARAYILPQVRNNEECLLNMATKILDTIRLKNFSVKPEHLLRSAYCEYHNSRSKKWILDLDNTEMYGWTLSAVEELVKKQLREIQDFELAKHPRKYATWLEDAMFTVKTKNGWHIITPPFNLQKALKECEMLFEGERTFKLSQAKTDQSSLTEKRIGWLHKDGMSLLYLNLPDENVENSGVQGSATP